MTKNLPATFIGNVLKFYGNGDGGNRWTLDPIDLSKWLAVNITVNGDRFDNNYVAELRTTINGATATKYITANETGARQYLPLNATASITSYTAPSIPVDGGEDNGQDAGSLFSNRNESWDADNWSDTNI